MTEVLTHLTYVSIQREFDRFFELTTEVTVGLPPNKTRFCNISFDFITSGNYETYLLFRNIYLQKRYSEHPSYIYYNVNFICFMTGLPGT